MRFLKFLWRNLIGLIVLAIIVIGVRYAIAKYHRPGTQTVLESQNMDVSKMGAPLGTVPVAAETVQESAFAPTVTYTGSVFALNDEDIYARVAGTLIDLRVYPGDHVRAGQIIGHLDSVELSSRSSESAFAKQAAKNEVGISEAERRQAQAQQRTAQAKVHSLQGTLRDVQSQQTAADAMHEQSERELEASQASLADAEANVTAMQSDVDYWNSEISREEKLYLAHAVSTDEYQRELAQAKTAQAKSTQSQAAAQEKRAMIAASKAKVRQAAAAITGMKARLEQASSDIVGAQSEVTASMANVAASHQKILQRSAMAAQTAAIDRTAGIVRGYTELRAHQDGVVTERLVSPGTLVQPGMPILRIKNINRLRLQANVAESDISGIVVGNPVTITTQRDSSFKLQTHISSIFSAANPQSRTVIVEALVSNPDNRLLPGQYIMMQIATARSRRLLTIPQTAERRDMNQKPYVWVVEAGKQGENPVARRVPVTLGSADGQRVVVLTGLKPGDKIVYAGHEDLKDGDMLSLTDWTPEGPKTLPEGSGQMAPMPGMDMGSGKAKPGTNPGTNRDGKPAAKEMPGMDMSGPKSTHEVNKSGSSPAGKSDKMENMPGMGGK